MLLSHGKKGMGSHSTPTPVHSTPTLVPCTPVHSTPVHSTPTPVPCTPVSSTPTPVLTIPVLVLIILVLVLIIVIIVVWLLRKHQQLRSLQQALQHQAGTIREPLQRSQPSPQSPQAAYPNPLYLPAKPPDRAAAVQPPLPSDTTAPLHPSRPNSSNANGLLNDKRWLKLVEECVGLFDDLDRHLASFDPARQELAEHVLLQLQEILERSNVELITGDATFERRCHQPEPPTTGAIPGMPIIKTLSPGFAVERRVLRRARVRLAEIPTMRNEMKGNEEA